MLNVSHICKHLAELRPLLAGSPYPHTSKSKAVHTGKSTGSICNREPCAKYTFVLIQGENELIPYSKACIAGLFFFFLAGCFARCAGCCKEAESYFSFALQCERRANNSKHAGYLCVHSPFYFQGHVVYYFFLL